MATDSFINHELTPENASPQSTEVSVIDASLRSSLTVLIASAIIWLLVAGSLGIIASWKLHTPAFLNGLEYLTYGRIQPAQSNAFIYGWGFNAAFAVSLWLMARLSLGVLPGTAVVLLGTLFWNVGVSVGVAGILLGLSTSIELLEMPGLATPVLLASYALIASWAFVVFKSGRSQNLFISQWYIFLALLVFPWVYSVVQVMLVFAPVRGTVQSVIQAWFSDNLFLLWFGSIALAAIYYFLPKILLKPIANYYLASIGFWWLVIFGSWAGLSRLIGGPVPAWVQTFGAAASFMLLVPLVIFGLNHYGTFAGRCSALKESTTLKFIAYGIIALSLMLLASVFTAIHGFAAITQFTLFSTAQFHLALYGFFSMVIFGAIYYIVPNVFLTPWANQPLVSVHFTASVLGITLLVGSLAFGGFKQGLQLANPLIPFTEVTQATQPFLISASFAWILLGIGQLAFAINFFWTLANASSTCVRSVIELLATQPKATP